MKENLVIDQQPQPLQSIILLVNLPDTKKWSKNIEHR